MEQSLVEHVGRGEWLDLVAKGEAVNEAAMRSWGDSRTCRAAVIRDILRGRLAADPDPHGLRLRGARISGRLDLDNLTTDVSLELRDCLLEEGVLARDARLASVSLAGCQLEHPAEPPLDAEGLTCRVLDLRGARIIGHADAGAVRLLGAYIGGSFYCSRARLRNDSGPALSGDALRVDQSMFLGDGFTATGTGRAGAVRLFGAHIGLNLYCEGGALRNNSGPALSGDGLQVGLSVFLRHGFTATGAGEASAVRLVGASIGGQLSCIGARLCNDSGPALLAHSLQVGLNVLLSGGFTATGGGDEGAVRLTGAHIGGSLECDGASLRNDSGPALSGDALQVDGAIFLRGGFTATGTGDVGTVRLRSAHIGGSLDCTAASLCNNSGPALNASSLQIGQGMYLRSGFTATGTGDLAANAYTELALHAEESNTWQHYSTKAEVHSLRARHSRGDGYIRSRIFDEIRLAKVRLAQREPVEAATVGIHAVHLAADTRSSLVVDWLIRFDRSLGERYPDLAETATFHDELKTYIRRTAPTRVGELE